MEIKASATYLRISPSKLRLLTKGLRGLSPEKALQKIQFYPQKGKDFLVKVIKQALANAKNNFKKEEGLIIKKIEVGEGPRLKRMDKSHGARFDRGIIHKKTAHLFLTLEAEEVKSQNEPQKPKNEKKVIKNKLPRSKLTLYSGTSPEEFVSLSHSSVQQTGRYSASRNKKIEEEKTSPRRSTRRKNGTKS